MEEQIMRRLTQGSMIIVGLLLIVTLVNISQRYHFMVDISSKMSYISIVNNKETADGLCNSSSY